MMSGERDLPPPFDGFEPLPLDMEPLDRRLRRDGMAWQAKVPDTRRLDALARTLATTLTVEKPEPEMPPRPDVPSETLPEVSAVRLIPFRRRSRTQNVLSIVAMVAIVSLMTVVLLNVARGGPKGASLATTTPHQTGTAQQTGTTQATTVAPSPSVTAPSQLHGTPGTVLWRFHTGNIIESPPAAANGIVYLGGADANLYAINAKTGARVWAVSVGATVQGSVVVANGLVYLTGVDGAVYAFKASDGTRVWRQQPAAANFGAVTVADGVVYVGSANNDASPSLLYALNAQTGNALWTLQTYGSVYAPPVVDGGALYAVAQDRSGFLTFAVFAVNLANHAKLWQTPAHGFVPVETNGIVYVAGGSPGLTAYSAASGNQLWSRTLDPNTEVGVSPPAVVDGVVYAGAGNGTLYALDAKSGKTLWSYLTSGEIDSIPVVANGVVYVGSVDDSVYALSKPGKVVWSYQTGGMVETSAVVAGGVVYIGSNDHYLYAIAA